jgi:pectinesterase inhibitor-like protein
MKFAAFLIVLVLLQQNSLKEVGADLISDTCGKTDRSYLCAKYLRMDPRGASARDAKGLTRVSYEFVLDSATGTLSRVKNLITGSNDPALKKYLNMCSNFYGTIVSDKVPNALKNLDSNSYVTAASLMSDAMFEAQMCERSFSIGPDVRRSPLTDKNTMVINLSDIAMHLTTSLP